jgi:hypothetical protein
MASTIAVCSLAACRAPSSAPASGPNGRPNETPVSTSDEDPDGVTAGEPEPTPAPEDSDELEIHGMFSTRFRGRVTSGDHDYDLYEFLELDVGDEERDEWSGTLVADAALDMDGHAEPSSPFQSLSDTYDSSLTARLYEAYVDNHSSKDLSRLRLGRQVVDRTPENVTFDGALIESRALSSWRVNVGVYGGIPARIYSSSEPGDVVYGTYADARPWSGGHARFDWMHLEDDELLGEHQDDLLAFRLGQAFGERWKLDGSYSRLEGRDRDVSARATYTEAESDFDVQIAWFQLLETQNDLAVEFDPFTSVLLEQFPYYQGRLMASKGFGATFRLQAGFDVREVEDEDDVGEFNRDFMREWATVSLTDVLPAELALSLTGELWNSHTDDIRTWGADLSRAVGSKARLALGSYYSLYKTDLYAVEEREDVRTYYVRLRTQGDTGWSWDVRYEFEDSSDHYSTLKLGATWRF